MVSVRVPCLVSSRHVLVGFVTVYDLEDLEGEKGGRRRGDVKKGMGSIRWA